MKLLIDGDALVFPVLSAAVQEAVDGDEIIWAYVNRKDVLQTVLHHIGSYIQKTGASDYLIAFSCPRDECFRREIMPSYKANRQSVKPLGFSLVKEALHELSEVVVWPGLEADDILGILQTQPGTDTMIVGVDKDFLTIPGRVLDPRTLDVREVSDDAADQAWLTQTLTGDSADGYPGARGFGPVSVAKLGRLDWEKVVQAFGGDEQEALRQARVARILRARDWDWKKKKPILWAP